MLIEKNNYMIRKNLDKKMNKFNFEYDIKKVPEMDKLIEYNFDEVNHYQSKT